MSEEKKYETRARNGELTEEELDDVSGGAFLRGTATVQRSAAVIGGSTNKLAAQSTTTLGCWHECTQNISGC